MRWIRLVVYLNKRYLFNKNKYGIIKVSKVRKMFERNKILLKKEC